MGVKDKWGREQEFLVFEPPRTGDEQLVLVYAVFQTLFAPDKFVSESGTHVFIDFKDAWNEIQAPGWGERAVYKTYVPKEILLDKKLHVVNISMHPWISVENRLYGWELVTPDDLLILHVEQSLSGETYQEKASTIETSWYASMSRTLAGLRVEGDRPRSPEEGIPDFGELQQILTMLPTKLRAKLSNKLMDLDKRAKSIAVDQGRLVEENLKLKTEIRRLQDQQQVERWKDRFPPSRKPTLEAHPEDERTETGDPWTGTLPGD